MAVAAASDRRQVFAARDLAAVGERRRRCGERGGGHK
jgi:hypothetical protein